MSLIDEALKRARMEAAQRAAEQEGLPYPTIPRHLGPRRRNRWLVPLVVALAVLGGVLLGLLLSSRGGAPAALTADGGIAEASAAPDAAALPPAEAAEPAAASPQAEAVPAAPPAEPRTRPAPPAGPPATSNRAPATRRAEAPTPTTQGAAPTPQGAAPTTEPAPRVAAPADPPAAVEPPPAPTARGLTPSPPAAAAPTPTATAVTDPDSGVLLTLPEGPPPSSPERPVEPGDAAAESYARSLPLSGGGVIELGGIAWSETGPFALINGQVVGPGSVIDGYTLERIRPGHVELTGEGRRIHLSLR